MRTKMEPLVPIRAAIVKESMRLVRSAAVAIVCGLALAACGGGGGSPGPVPSATAAPAPTATPLTASYVFAGDASGKTTVEYGLAGTAPIATLSATGAPNAFAFDASGNVYVAFGGATVEEHGSGTHRLLRTIAGFHHVNAIAVDAKGTLYVVDGSGLPAGSSPTAPSNLSRILPGATSPSAVLLSFPYTTTSPTLISVAVDAGGSVYAGANNSRIYVFAPGTTAPTRTFSISPQSPTELTLDRSGNLYVYATLLVPDQSSSTIYGFAPGAETPLVTITTITYGTTPQSLAFDRSNDLYEINDPLLFDPAQPPTAGSVVEFPAAGTVGGPARTFNFPVSLAIDPAKNLYVLDADSVVGQNPGPGEHINEYASASTVPTRTFESSGSAIGLSSVP